jgi:hypothetical protein
LVVLVTESALEHDIKMPPPATAAQQGIGASTYVRVWGVRVRVTCGEHHGGLRYLGARELVRPHAPHGPCGGTNDLCGPHSPGGQRQATNEAGPPGGVHGREGE